MKLHESPKDFQPITKQLIRTRLKIRESDELCGVASIAMLVAWCGITGPFDDIYRRMLALGIYVKGTGTYLQYAPQLYPHQLHYLHYMPFFLTRFLLAHHYRMAVSIKEDGGGGHIVFVCGGDKQNIYYYDPNKDKNQKSMSYKVWKQKSNRRAVVMKQSYDIISL